MTLLSASWLSRLRMLGTELGKPASCDIVMGIAVNYSIETISPFVESLRTDGAFSGDVVMFIGPRDNLIADYLKSRGIIVQKFDGRAQKIPNLMLWRWFAYRAFLKQRLKEGRQYNNILICDVRDVIFQNQLFKSPSAEIEFHLEADTPRIGQCPWNSKWIRDAFGEAMLKRLTDSRISCAGTISGRQDGILRYLDVMIEIIESLKDYSKNSLAADQGIHNYIVHTNVLNEASVCENYHRVATVGYVDSAILRTDTLGRVLNPDGNISEICHQWDRHPQLAEVILATAQQRRTVVRQQRSIAR